MTVRRFGEIDLARAFGMLAVIWGHIMLGGRTNLFVYSFHIPLFFFLSGMVFRKEKYTSFSSFLKRRARSLLLPYAFYSVLTWCYWVLRSLVLRQDVTDSLSPLLQTLLAQGSGGYLVHNVALWFVPCLFVTEMLYYFLSRLPRALTAGGVCVCGVLAWLMLRAPWDFTRLPWSVDVALTGIVFYAAGNLLASLHTRLRTCVSHHGWAAVLGSILLFLLLFFSAAKNGHVTLAQGKLGESILLFYANAFLGIAASLLLCTGIDYTVTSRRTAPPQVKRCYEAVQRFGQSSFRAMALHVPIMVDMIWLVSKLTGADIHGLRYALRYTIPIFFAVLLLCTLWLWLLRRIERKLPEK